MTKQYTSLEHSIRNIMEGRSNKVEHPKTLEQSILEGGHTLEERVGPRPPNANNTSSGFGDTATAAGLLPFVGTTMDAVDAYKAYQDGEYGNALGLGALAAAGLVSDIGMFTGLGTGPSVAGKAALTATRIARAVDRASDVADVAKTAAKAAAADAASDSALIRRITSGKKKGSNTPPPANAPETQGNLALKPQEFKPTTTRTDDKIDVQKPANAPGAPGTTNVISLPPRTTQVTPANPNTIVTTPGQAPANVNAPTYKPSVPTTTVKPSAAANQTTAPNVTKTDAGDAATRRNTDSDAVPSTRTDKDTAPETATVPNKDPATVLNKPKAKPKARPKLRLSLPSIKTAFDSQSAAGQASGVGTYMHKAGAPLKVSEENEADTARTSIENVARLNSRRGKAVKQQEIQKKILDEKKSLADTVKRNVEEIRTKRKTESPIITNPELKRPEPEGINNVR